MFLNKFRVAVIVSATFWMIGCGGGGSQEGSAGTTYTVTTIAGAVGEKGIADGMSPDARFTDPYGVAVDGNGNLYISSSIAGTIRKITPQGIVSTLAGFYELVEPRDGVGTDARLMSVTGLAADPDGNIYFVENSGTLRRVTPAGVVTTIAGVNAQRDSVDGIGTDARFNEPYGIAIDLDRNLYVTDYMAHTIRKITPTGVVTTLAGKAGQKGFADGVGSVARFDSPAGIGVDRRGNIYIADEGNHIIRKITPTGVVSTIAGIVGEAGHENGAGAKAKFYLPSGLAVSADGEIFVHDWSRVIRKITSEGVVTPIAGADGEIDHVDGVGIAARFHNLGGVAVDKDGNLYVAEIDRQTIRKISPNR